MVIDGEEKKETLFSMVKSTLPAVSNSVIAFHDNSSVSKVVMPGMCEERIVCCRCDGLS